MGTVPGLVRDRPRGISFLPFAGQFAVDSRSAPPQQQTGLVIADRKLLVAAQQRHQERQHRGQQRAGRGRAAPSSTWSAPAAGPDSCPVLGLTVFRTSASRRAALA